MIKLIKNEIIKLLHKKSIYIVLIITALFIGLISYLNSLDTSGNVTTQVEYNGEEEFSKEINEYYKKYNQKDWQFYVFDVYQDVVSKYYQDKTNEEYIKEYNDTKKALDNNDWKYFVNKNLKTANEELLALKESLSENIKNTNNINDLKATIYQKEIEIENLNYRLKENITYGEDYINDALNNVYNTSYAKYYYENIDNKNKDYEEAVKTFYENKYILDTKENNNSGQDLKSSLMYFMEDYIFLILVFGVMISGSIVSEEYNKGTIKSLLITPYKRSSILLSKFITVIIMLLAYIVVAYLMDLIIGGCFLGFSSLNNHVAIYNISTKSLEVMGIFKYILIKTLAILPEIILLITLAFSISTIIGSTPVAIVLTFAGFISSSIINTFAIYYKIDILKYFVTTNWDFNEFLFGATSRYNVTLIHSVVTCIIYFLIMIITSFIVFKHKNIKNI